MKRLGLVVLMALMVVGAVALASVPGNRIATVSGANIRCFTTNDGGTLSTGRTGLDLDIQCPNVDAGGGQKVWARAGCALKADGGGTCLMDAGVGDLVLDFTTATGNPDPIHYKLGTSEDRICFGAVASYAIAVHCNIYERRP